MLEIEPHARLDEAVFYGVGLDPHKPVDYSGALVLEYFPGRPRALSYFPKENVPFV
jgi:hypothetical protein